MNAMDNSDSLTVPDLPTMREQTDSLSHSPFSNILIYISGSAGSMEAIRMGVSIASVHKLPVILLYVIEEKKVVGVASINQASHEVVRRQIEEKSRRYLNYAEQLAQVQGVSCQQMMRQGIAHLQITEVARRANVDLIVIGDDRQPAERWTGSGGLIGRVIEYAHCSVLVVRTQ